MADLKWQVLEGRCGEADVRWQKGKGRREKAGATKQSNIHMLPPASDLCLSGEVKAGALNPPSKLPLTLS